MSVQSEALKDGIAWFLQTALGPHAKTIPLGALDAIVERGESQALDIGQMLDRLPEAGAASEATLLAVAVKAEAIRALLAGTLTTADAATLAKVEAVRALLAGTLTASINNFPGDFPDANGLAKAEAIRTLLAGVLSMKQDRSLAGTGNITSAASTITVTLPANCSAVAVVVSGTYAGVTFAADVSEDNALFDTGISGYSYQATASAVAFTPGANATKRYIFPVNGAAYLKIRATAWTSGTANVAVYSLPEFAVPANIAAVAQSGTWTMQPGNTANTTPWLFTPRSATTGGLTRHRLLSAATTNATVAKAAAGQLYTVHGHNTSATDRYLKFYNKATAPTVGTDAVVETYVLKAGQPFRFDFSTIGNPFSAGISYAITGALADADTTAIAANDIVLNLHYT